MIWQKYILSKILKTFFFFLICLLVIYVIIDLSAHGVRFFSKASFKEISLFYLNTFSTQLDLFFTITFLLATLRVLFNLSSHREIVALQMAGISKKKLLYPFFLFAACIALVGYMNCQWLAPHAGEHSSGFKTAYKAKKKGKVQKLYTVSFDDESELVYQRFNKEKRELFDVFWVRSPEDVWHMKSLEIDSLKGYFVNHLIRNEAKQFEKQESFVQKQFSEIPLQYDAILNRFIPYESRPLSSLFLQAYAAPADARIVFSHLYYKLLAPIIPFIVIVAIGPIAMRYTRNRPSFLIVALSIFGLLGLKTVIDGMLILGENQVLPSYIAIFAPILIVLSIAVPTFARMR